MLEDDAGEQAGGPAEGLLQVWGSMSGGQPGRGGSRGRSGRWDLYSPLLKYCFVSLYHSVVGDDAQRRTYGPHLQRGGWKCC